MGEASTGDGAGAEPREGFLGLAEEEVALLGQVFAASVADLGIDGRAVFDGLRRGRTLAQALGLPPEVNEVLYARAHGWFAAGRHDRAEALFRALSVLDPRSADAWVGFGICLKLREAWDEAAAALAAAAALRPDWAIPHFHAVELEVRRGRWAEAEAHLDVFDRRAGTGDVPAEIHREAGRLRAIIDLQGERPS